MGVMQPTDGYFFWRGSLTVDVGLSLDMAMYGLIALRKTLPHTPSMADELRTLRSTPSLRAEAVRR